MIKNHLTIAITVFAFYLLDFAINAVQASTRALIVDVAPLHQQDSANAWARYSCVDSSGMIGFANVCGFFIGGLDLSLMFPWSGLDQMQLLCSFAILTLVIAVMITCWKIKEKPWSLFTHPRINHASIVSISTSFTLSMSQLWTLLFNLPFQLKKLFAAQFFSWFGWFPLLFYT